MLKRVLRLIGVTYLGVVLGIASGSRNSVRVNFDQGEISDRSVNQPLEGNVTFLGMSATHNLEFTAAFTLESFRDALQKALHQTAEARN